MVSVKLNFEIPQNSSFIIRCENQSRIIDSSCKNIEFNISNSECVKINIVQEDELSQTESFFADLISFLFGGIFRFFSKAYGDDGDDYDDWTESIVICPLNADIEFSGAENEELNLCLKQSYFDKKTDRFVSPQIIFQDPHKDNISVKYVSSVDKKDIKAKGRSYILNVVSTLFYPWIFLLFLFCAGIKKDMSHMWIFSAVVILLSLLILGFKARNTYVEINRLNEKADFFQSDKTRL